MRAIDVVRFVFRGWLAAVLALTATALSGTARAADDPDQHWPAWRGAAGTGASAQKGVPSRWSATENVRWKIKLPAPGNSTPIVWGDHVFLTSATADGSTRSLLCLHRDDGRVLWQRDVSAPAKELTHDTNPYGASSPTTDGKHVYVWHGTAGLWAYDFAGKELWHKEQLEQKHIWGYASSPVLVGDLVVISAGPGVRCLLAAYDKSTGKEAWKRDLPEAQSKDEKEFVGSWSTPVWHTHAGRGQLILSLPKQLRAFDPQTGRDLWQCDGLGNLAYTSPLVAGDIAVGMSGYSGPALACRVTGSGNITAADRLWHVEQKNPQRIGSGVIVDGKIYILNEHGIAWCIDLASGQKLWEERLSSTSWSSMIHIDGRLYAQTATNQTLVLAPNPEKCTVLQKNQLDPDTTRATPAFAAGRIYIRGYKQLYCIEERGK